MILPSHAIPHDEDAPLDIVFLGLSITSSWGNGHATNYRALCAQLTRRGHRVLFLERDKPWYASRRDLPKPGFCECALYESVEELETRWAQRIASADAVIVGSYVPEGVRVGRLVQSMARGAVGFYDIDTPITLAKLRKGDHEYLHPDLVPGYHFYLSFTGGRALKQLRCDFGSPSPHAFYCFVDPEHHCPARATPRHALGYLGTYSDDRQPPLDALLLETARRKPNESFVVAGPQYPDSIEWPLNVEHIEHIPPQDHAAFYASQRYTLNITRQAMRSLGWSPSVRLFEAAACGVPIISDWWEGLDEIFIPGCEILVAEDADDVLRFLHDIDEEDRCAIAARARVRVLREHTAAHRAPQLETIIRESLRESAPPLRVHIAPGARPQPARKTR